MSASEQVQQLWSDYGAIMRCHLTGAAVPSVIVKHIRLSTIPKHPRGWHTEHSHGRKLHSYAVECAWYRNWAGQCDAQCRVPHCYADSLINDDRVLILEDLDSAGFARRHSQLSVGNMTPCLEWLAHFHARFMHRAPESLWKQGSYWHLATRPDEHAAMTNPRLQRLAARIDQALTACPYQTIIHGDAKVANFCFGELPSAPVAAVDFQYVGAGCGIIDVIYFMSSCCDEATCAKYADSILQRYFSALRQALPESIDGAQVEQSWRSLYPYAWADFVRFLDGWSPNHWKMHAYSQEMCDLAMDSLAMDSQDHE